MRLPPKADLLARQSSFEPGAGFEVGDDDCAGSGRRGPQERGRSEAHGARLFSLLMQIILPVQRKKAPCYVRKTSQLIPLT